MSKNRKQKVSVEREVSSALLESNYSQISASIMNEVFNHFGHWKCHLFDAQGDYLVSEIKKIA